MAVLACPYTGVCKKHLVLWEKRGWELLKKGRGQRVGRASNLPRVGKSRVF